MVSKCIVLFTYTIPSGLNVVSSFARIAATYLLVLKYIFGKFI